MNEAKAEIALKIDATSALSPSPPLSCRGEDKGEREVLSEC
jgi:hypothetical protein